MNHYFIVFALLILSACSAKPYVVDETDINVKSSQQVSVVSHDWHTGFVIPTDIIFEQLPELAERFFDSPYLEFGWGDKGFYQAEEISFWLALKAILWPTESVMHVVAVPVKADVFFHSGEVKNFCLDNKQFALLVSFLEQSFYKDSSGKVIEYERGIYGDSQFYKGEGDYYSMNTCNSWTAKGLRSAGFDISTTFKLTAGSIKSFLNDYDGSLNMSECATGEEAIPASQL